MGTSGLSERLSSCLFLLAWLIRNQPSEVIGHIQSAKNIYLGLICFHVTQTCSSRAAEPVYASWVSLKHEKKLIVMCVDTLAKSKTLLLTLMFDMKFDYKLKRVEACF